MRREVGVLKSGCYDIGNILIVHLGDWLAGVCFIVMLHSLHMYVYMYEIIAS